MLVRERAERRQMVKSIREIPAKGRHSPCSGCLNSQASHGWEAPVASGPVNIDWYFNYPLPNLIINHTYYSFTFPQQWIMRAEPHYKWLSQTVGEAFVRLAFSLESELRYLLLDAQGKKVKQHPTLKHFMYMNVIINRWIVEPFRELNEINTAKINSLAEPLELVSWRQKPPVERGRGTMRTCFIICGSWLAASGSWINILPPLLWDLDDAWASSINTDQVEKHQQMWTDTLTAIFSPSHNLSKTMSDLYRSPSVQHLHGTGE